MSSERSSTESRIHAPLAERWSPYAFADRDVQDEDLRRVFEAARWAASSYNEQPWSYVVATRQGAGDYARVLSCLVDANQAWAKAAPVLALGIVHHRFRRNGKENRAAVHDLGLASAGLTIEATTRGLVVHQMIGIHPDKARETFAIPEECEAWTALAIGYRGEPESLPGRLAERDLAPRTRKPLTEFVFGAKFGSPSPFISSTPSTTSATSTTSAGSAHEPSSRPGT